MSDAEASLLVAIVVPVYNEEEAIGPFHDSLVQVLESLPHHAGPEPDWGLCGIYLSGDQTPSGIPHSLHQNHLARCSGEMA